MPVDRTGERLYIGPMTQTLSFHYPEDHVSDTVSWLSSEGVIKNGGLRPPGTEGLQSPTGSTKPKAKTEKKTPVKGTGEIVSIPDKPITDDRVTSEGLYKFGETVARVKISATSRKPYALVKNVDTGEWAYTPGVVSKLRASDRVQEAPVRKMSEGWYAHAGTVAEVKTSKRGYAYATLLCVDTGKFEYVQGLVTQIDPSARLTLSQAVEMGKQFHRCMICGAELTNDNSIDRGIGPICAGKL